jgi:chromosome segregation ATPase
MERILENYTMEIIESTILGLRQRIEGYENDIKQNDVQLQLYLKRQKELQSGLEQLKQELKVQERKKTEEESPAGQERRRLAEARRQYIELQQQKRELKVPIQSAQMQRLGLLRRRNSVESKVARLPPSGINKLNSHGQHFSSKFNTLMSGFSGEQAALEKLEKLKTDGGKKHKTRKR